MAASIAFLHGVALAEVLPATARAALPADTPRGPRECCPRGPCGRQRRCVPDGYDTRGSLAGIARGPVAVAGRNLGDVLLAQSAKVCSDADLAEARRDFTALRGGTLVAPSTITSPEPARAVLFRDSVQPYLPSLVQHDPAVSAPLGRR